MTQILITLAAEERTLLANEIAAILLPQIAALQSAGAIINQVVNDAAGADVADDAEEGKTKTTSKKTTTRKTTKKAPVETADEDGDDDTEEEKPAAKTTKKAPPVKNKKPAVDLTQFKEDAADWLEWIEGDDDILPQVEEVLEGFGVTSEADVSDEDYPEFHAAFREIIAANFDLSKA